MKEKLTNQLKPTQLTVITTANCTAKCDHCVMYCTPGDKRTLSYEQMQSAVDQFNEINPLSLVVFSGGEPLLLGEDLLEALAYCNCGGILTRIVTNCYWAKDDASARAVLRELRESGLWELNISCDDYHTPYVPFEHVIRAYKNSKGMGFSAVVLANSHSKKSTITPQFIEENLGENICNRYDDNGLSLPDGPKDEDGTFYLLSNALLQNVGRAREKISSENFTPLSHEKLMVGCRWCATNPALSPINHLWACCGIQCDGNEVLDLGDLNEKSIAEIMRKAEDNILLTALRVLGPMYLRDFIATAHPEIQFRDNYASVCEVCEDLTTNKEALLAMKRHYLEIVHAIRLVEEKQNEQQNI